MPGRTRRVLLLSLAAAAAVEVVLGATAVSTWRGDVDDGAAATPPATTATAPRTRTCVSSPNAPAITLPSTAPWIAGTAGERAGFAPGASIFGDSDEELRDDLRTIAALGVRWIRLDIDWSYIGSAKGTLRWCAADRVVSAARDLGLEVIALPTYTPAWARPAGTSDKHPPTHVEDFAAFVEAAARRYVPLGVTTWEIWNEPNVSKFWAPRPDAARYARLLEAGSAAVRKVWPTATVLTGGTAPARDRDDGRTIAPATFLRRVYAAGAKPWFDAVATHPYSFPAGPLDNDSGDWNAFVRLPELRRVMVDNGDRNKTVWITEYGAPTAGGSGAVDPDKQATMASDAYSARARFPWLGPILWYSLRDNGEDGLEGHFGLLEADFTPKPALAEFRSLMLHPVAAEGEGE